MVSTKTTTEAGSSGVTVKETTSPSGKRTITITKPRAGKRRTVFTQKETGEKFIRSGGKRVSLTKQPTSVQERREQEKAISQLDKSQRKQLIKERDPSTLETRSVSVEEPSGVIPLRKRQSPQPQAITQPKQQETIIGAPSKSQAFFDRFTRDVPQQPKLGEKIVTGLAERFEKAQVFRESVVGALTSQKGQIQTAPLKAIGSTVEFQGEGIKKAGFQSLARVIGSPEQQQEATFFKRGEQSDAFFKAISPIAPKPITESRVSVGSSNEFGQSGTAIVQQVPTGETKLGINLPGLVNIATAGVTAGFVAAPILTRPTSPLKGIRGDIDINVNAFTRKGVTRSATDLTFTRRSPTLTGAFGGKAKTTVTTVQPGGGARIVTDVGSKRFTFAQLPGAGRGTLTVEKGGSVSKVIPQARIDIGSRAIQGVESAELTNQLLAIGKGGQKITSFQTGIGESRVTLQTGKFEKFSGKLNLETVVKQVTDAGRKPGTFPLEQATIGTGTLTRQPIIKVTPPLPTGIGAVSPGGIDFGFNPTFRPTTGALKQVSTPEPTLKATLPKTPKTTPFRISAPLPVQQSFIPVPPLSFVKPSSSTRATPSTGIKPSSIGETGPISRIDPGIDFKPISESIPSPDVTPEPLITPESIPEVVSPTDLPSPSPFDFQTPKIPIPGQFIQPPIIGAPLTSIPAFGGGFEGVGFTPPKRRSRKRASKTIFQSIFNLPEDSLKSVGVAKGKEKTGLLLRF